MNLFNHVYLNHVPLLENVYPFEKVGSDEILESVITLYVLYV